MDSNTGPPYNAQLRAPGEHPDSPSDHFPSSMSHDPAAAQPVVSEHQPFARDVAGSHDGHRSVHGDYTLHSDTHFDGHSPTDSGAPIGPVQSPNGRPQSHGGRETPSSGRNTPEFAHPDAVDERASEPSPDVDLSLSTEDVTEGRHTGDGLLGGGFVNPLGVAEVAPGKLFLPGQAGKSGSVRSRGRVPDPLEVLPFDEAPQTVPAGMAPGSTRAPRRAIPHSSYYNGPPALDSAYGSDPVGVIGKHYPREILRIERDYSGGELCQFHPTFPLELEGRITPVQHQESMNSINEVLISAHKLFPSFLYNALAVVTLYVSTLFFSSHYDKEMQRLRLLIDQLNREIYNPQGLNILWPQRTAFLFLEIEYY